MELPQKPEKIILAMKPAYVVQDIPYDPNTLEEYRHKMIDPIAPYLSKLDFAQMTVEEMQTQIDEEPAPVDPNHPQGAQDAASMQQQEETPPEDNTADRDSTESQTPELDSTVERFSRVINTK
jgi:hypothetical protein